MPRSRGCLSRRPRRVWGDLQLRRSRGSGSPRMATPDARTGILLRDDDRHRAVPVDPAERRRGDPRLRPQRGRLRGARRPPRGRRLRARRRPRGRRHGRGQHLRLRRGRQEGLGRHAARGGRPQGVAGHGGRARPSSPSGCLAERYGKDLAESLPEADAVLGFDDYPDIAAKLRSIVAGETHHAAHAVRPPPAAADLPGRARRLRDLGARARRTSPRPTTRRDRRGCARRPAPAPYAVGSTPARWRRSSWPAAATGAARSARSPASAARSSAVARATCCSEGQWLATQGVKELFLVSENSTSYGKDLGDLRLLETMLPELSGIDGHRAGAGVLPPARRDAARA